MDIPSAHSSPQPEITGEDPKGVESPSIPSTALLNTAGQNLNTIENSVNFEAPSASLI